MTLIRFVCVAGIAYGAYSFGLRGGCGSSGALACPVPALEEGVGVTLSAEEVCRKAGYLCNGRDSFQVMRWQLDQGKLRVRVSLPDFIGDPETARQVRDAAVEGILAWDRHPFPLVIDAGKFAYRFPDIRISWSEGFGAGHASLRGRPEGKRYVFEVEGFSVVVPPLSSGSIALTPGSDPAAMMAQVTRMMGGQQMGPAVLAQVKATAMHEMGHALGLMHSGFEDDIMFPEFRRGLTQVRLSSRDLDTVDALYRLPNGAMLQ